MSYPQPPAGEGDSPLIGLDMPMEMALQVDMSMIDFDAADIDIDALIQESGADTGTFDVLGAPGPSLSSHSSSSDPVVTLPHLQVDPALLPEPLPPQAIAPAPSPGPAVAPSPPTRKQRLERRGHTKSRRGCYNCKRRRIKCQETRPACGHCVKGGLNCEYPATPTVVHQPSNQVPIFTMLDMRFFQHFMLACVPFQPIGNEQIWTHEILCLSQNYEYLMHAILGYAASDLIPSNPSYVTAAMNHRIKAIKAIKRSLRDMVGSPVLECPSQADCSSCSSPSPPPQASRAKLPTTQTLASNSHSILTEQGNAMMATCFALTFQSVLLDDGLVEFMTFIRGILIIAIQLYLRGGRFLFSNLTHEDKVAILGPKLDAHPLLAKEYADPAKAAVYALEPLIAKANEVTKEFYGYLRDIVDGIYVSNSKAYGAISAHYGWWMMLPHAEFQLLVESSTTAPVLALLYTHWIALKQIMVSILELEQTLHLESPVRQEMKRRREQNCSSSGGATSYCGVEHSGGDGGGGKLADTAATSNRRRQDGNLDSGMERWLAYLNKGVPTPYRKYNTWPEWVQMQVDADPCFFGRTM